MIIRCEISLDGGKSWRLANIRRFAEPNEYGTCQTAPTDLCPIAPIVGDVHSNDKVIMFLCVSPFLTPTNQATNFLTLRSQGCAWVFSRCILMCTTSCVGACACRQALVLGALGH